MKSIRLALNLVLVLFIFGSSAAYSNDFYRLKNRWTNEYMHIEHKAGYVELSKRLVSTEAQIIQYFGVQSKAL